MIKQSDEALGTESDKSKLEIMFSYLSSTFPNIKKNIPPLLFFYFEIEKKIELERLLSLVQIYQTRQDMQK